jgi:hypothetical protein
VRAVPPGAGVVSTRVDDLVSAVWRFVHDPALAQEAGTAARAAALGRFGLARFLADWDQILGAGCADFPQRKVTAGRPHGRSGDLAEPRFKRAAAG